MARHSATAWDTASASSSHEDPRLAQESRSVLEAGNVVTVEPGIYLSGLGGIRIEDLVIVTDAEPEVLTTFPKELRTLD